MQTLLDTLAGLANDGKWYSRTALGAKLNGKRSVLAAISRLRRVPGYRVEKRRVTEHATSGSTASPPGLPSPLLDGLFLPRLPTTIPAIPRQVATMTGDRRHQLDCGSHGVEHRLSRRRRGRGGYRGGGRR